MTDEQYQKELEQQRKWSDIIFNVITNSGARNFDEAEKMVVAFYVMDVAVSRAGISDALVRLKRHYEKSSSEAQP